MFNGRYGEKRKVNVDVGVSDDVGLLKRRTIIVTFFLFFCFCDLNEKNEYPPLTKKKKTSFFCLFYFFLFFLNFKLRKRECKGFHPSTWPQFFKYILLIRVYNLFEMPILSLGLNV